MVLPNGRSNKRLYLPVVLINGFLIIGLGILIIQSFQHQTKGKVIPKWKTDLRLSPYIQPKMYELFLHPNLESGVFSGHVSILIKVETLQPYVAVHIKWLNISSTRITKFIDSNDQSTEIKVKSAFEYEKNEFWVIIPRNELKIGLYKLHLHFSGKLTDKIVGFYNSRYVDENGKNRVIVTSKFEPTFARQAFPCFDEPSFKAKYVIKIVRPSETGFIALSNMNRQEEIKDSPAANETTVVFAKSVEISTYLVCFIVCDFANLKPAVTNSGFPITVYARHDQIDNMHYALEVAVKVVNYYVQYFDITYPLPKLDLIAIPDFVSGAMENWGLITFRETSILYNSIITTTVGQFNVALTIAHELAHMWFGNLVTMKWWNDLWLNEGYASYIEYKGVAKVHPEWNLDSLFLIHDLHAVLELDATLNSHPIVHDVVNPDQITEIFDKISYNKGASIIRMLEATIGERNFSKGVQSYLISYKFSSAETKDLWYHMQQYTSEYSVSAFMDTWTQQMGFPLISVTRRNEFVTFKQKRFLADSTLTYDKTDSPFEYQWDVPITYITSINRYPEMVWLHKNHESINVTLPPNVSWIKVNYHQKGYYRVNYETSEWYNIINLLLKEHETVSEPDRANLLNDAFSLADAELINYDIPLQLANYLVNEKDLVPWETASTLLSSLRNRLLNTAAYNSSASYIKNLLTPMEDKIWSIDGSSSFTERYLQASLFRLGCSVGSLSFLTNAKTMFIRELDNIDRTEKLSPDLSDTIYYYGIQNSNLSEWNKLWDLFIKEQNPQEKRKLMTALTASKDTVVLEKFLYLCKNENYIRSQDFLILLTNMASNPVGSSIVWDFVRNEWQFLVNRYTLNDRYLGQMVFMITKNFATADKYNEMIEFFAQYPEAGAGIVSRKQALEKVTLNIKWRQKHVSKLNNWFNDAVGEI